MWTHQEHNKRVITHEDNNMISDTTVKARISHDVKERAVSALAKMGLNTSDLIRMVMIRVADEGKLPFDIKTPNVVTKEAIEELEKGNGKAFSSTNALFDDLGI